MQGGGGSSQMPSFNSTDVTNNQVKANANAMNNSMAANLINQVTPFGSLNYTQSGGTYDYYGNFIPSYTATSTVSPEVQTMLSGKIGAANTASGLAPGLGAAANNFGTTANEANDWGQVLLRKAMGNLGQPTPDYSTYRDDAYNALMARSRTELDRADAATKNESANSGIAAGSEAYNRALQPINQSRVDASNQATINASDLADRDLSRYITLRDLPLNEWQSVIGGANSLAGTSGNLANVINGISVGAPTGPSFVSTPQSQMQAPDVTSAPMAAYNAQMQAYSAQQQAQARQGAGLMGGLFGLAGTIGGGIAGGPLGASIGSGLFGLGGSALGANGVSPMTTYGMGVR